MNSLSQSRLKDALNYNPLTGVFTRRNKAGRYPAGSVAGTRMASGYIQINLDGKFYRAHRLAWLYVYGEMPTLLDHKNRVRDNNWIENLRLATYSENHQNRSISSANTSGFIGVSFCKRTGKW